MKNSDEKKEVKNIKKKKNTFKFQNFAERISNIKVDVYHNIRTKEQQFPENDKDTFFRENLERWTELNCSLDFTAFYREIKRYVQSFNQLLFHKETVLEILKKYLSLKTPLALEPCLDLVATLSRDLLVDFCPYFEEIFTLLTGFLATHDTDLIEHTFISLAHIFKFTWRYLVADLENIFKTFKCLLSSQQKPHIQNFAAESFAFLVRKCKQKQSILRFLFSEVACEPSLANGIGALVFHTIKGIKWQLNSSAEDVLRYCLELLQEFDHADVFSILTKIWSMSLHHVAATHSYILFDTILYELKIPKKACTLHYILDLLEVCVVYKDGRYIPDQKCIVMVLGKLIITLKNQSMITSFTNLCKSIMTIQYCTLTDSDLTSLFTGILSFDAISLHEKLSFCLQLMKWSRFNELCLPTTLHFLAKCFLKESDLSDLLELTVQLTYQDENMFKRPSSLVSFYSFDFPLLSNVTVPKMLAKKLEEMNWKEDLETQWSIVVCLSACGRHENFTDILGKFCETIKCWFSLNIDHLTQQQLYFLSSFINCILTLAKDNHQDLISFNWLLTLLRSYPSNLHIVDCFEHYCNQNTILKTIDIDLKDELFNLLKENLNSPYQKLRLLTLMVLQNMYSGIEEKDLSTSVDVFKTCIEAENIEVTFQTYRDKLLCFQRLMYTSTSSLSSLYRDVVVRILAGNLFINLSVLWDSIIDIITSYAVDENDQFWNTWKDIFLLSSQKSESSTSEQSSMVLNSVFERYFNLSQNSNSSTVDYKNFRILLLKAMTKFVPLVERRSRDIVPLFLEFIQKEYTCSDEILSQRQDIRANKETNEATVLNDEDSSAVSKIDRKTKVKTLCAYLSLFKLFKHPRGLVKEPKIHQLYLDFLISKDNEIQSLTIDCLMTYNYRYLKPYAENFSKLMNDTTFRDELLLFSTDKENEVLKAEHRPDLMPILIRLLYGKLLRKSGLGASGKSNLSARRNVIMQFLSNCSNNEIQTFIDLIMEPFKPYQDLDFTRSTELDISAVIPLRRQAGFINMLSDIVNRLHKIAKPFLPQLFSNLLSIIWMSCTCLNQSKDQINPIYLGRIKLLRHAGTMKLSEIFERLVDFQYDEYLTKIFSGVIWPQISLLSVEAIQNVTPLFHLILVFSKHNRYQPLLSFTSKGNQSLLTHMFNILKQNSISYIIEKQIMTVTLNLLSSEDYIQDEKNVGKPLLKQNFTSEKPIGVQIVEPFVPIVIDHVSKKLLEKTKDLSIKTKQKFSKFLPEIQLAVLSKISLLVNDKSLSESIVRVLFPLLQCVSSEDIQVFIITSLKNMITNVASVVQYLPKFPFLFHSVTSRKSRQMLCDFYHELTQKANEMTNLSQLVLDLNSWDKKHLDEPDFDRRLDAFRRVGEQIHSWSIKELLPILYNCLHFISTTEDMSIRDASTSCVQKVIQQTASHKAEMYSFVVLKVLLPAVKQGLKSKKEAVRTEYLGILALLVKTFDNSCFSDMKLMSSEDPEMCFFENMKHIQVHRRIKAIHQVSKLCNDGKLSASTMFSFILPLICHNIFGSLSTTKDHNLLSESISAIGSIMKCLPWAKYSMVLSNYLKLLRTDKNNQRTITRVLTAILNNFHFDVETSSNESEQNVDTKILNAVSTKFLPQLQNFLKKKSKVSDFHKLSKNQKEDEEDIMKIPVTLAVVKLLQRLPVETLKNHLPGLLLRVSQSLRSHARDVRDVARETMLNICLSLGPSYLSVVFKEMRSVLLRGYQLHILGFTVHSLLVGMKDVLQPGDLDSSVKLVMEILMEQYFGNVSEEKEIAGITTKLHEAKSKKSIESIEILAKFISANCIAEIISPLQEILIRTISHKEIHSIEEALRLIAVGIHQNKGICIDELIIFIYGVVSNTLSLLLSKDQPEKATLKNDNVKQDDIFLVPSAPSRSGKVPGISKHTNEHVLVEFGLQLLQTALKRQKILPSSEQHIKMLDPFVKILLNSITSKYIRIVTLTIRCMVYIIKFNLPSMEASIPEFAKHLFKILKKYARNCGGKGDNFELVSITFKALTVLIRDTTVFKVTNKQLQILLAFVEEDIYNSSRQSTALPLLKAILSRKITGNEVHEVMAKVSELLVRDHDESIRLQCRQLLMQYLFDYPLGKKIADHLNFLVSHLTYEEETGRKSVLEMLASIFNNFPKHMLLEYNGYFFIPLVMMLVNDDSVSCRKMATAAIKLLLKKIETGDRDRLFNVVLKWGTQEKILLRQVFFQCIGMFAEVERENFERRIDLVLPSIDAVLKKAVCNDEESSDDDDDINELTGVTTDTNDKLAFNGLTCLGKLFSVPNLLLGNKKYSGILAPVWGSVYELLLHAHAWIRLAASQMFTIYFSLFAPHQLVLLESSNSEEYMGVKMNLKIKMLCSAFCTQLKDSNLSQSVAEQATKNLIYLTKVVKLIDPWINESKQEELKEKNSDDQQKPITFKSLVTKMCQLASYESSHAPKNTIKRISVLRWIAALCLDGGIDRYLVDILRPVHREISSSLDQGSDLYKLALEVMELFRSTVQKDQFALVYSQLQKKMSENRESRKRKMVEEAVSNPQKFALRKQKFNLAKREQRKRKLHKKKPELKFKKLRSKPEDL